MLTPPTLSEEPKAPVVVGIDGSVAAVEAALWAAEEAFDRGVGLRLTYVVDSGNGECAPDEQARLLATAEIAVRHALTAVESTELPITIEMQILQGRPVPTLREAARTAAMLCVGARGLKHSTTGRIGSTAAALSETAVCPVAIVRSRRQHYRRDRSVVIEITDNAAGTVVLQQGLDEARRRRAPARILTPTRTHADLTARWERRFVEWRVKYPDVDITAVGTHGDTLNYLAANADSIALVVTGRTRPGGLDELLGASGNTALRDTDCSILVCEPGNAL